MKLTIKFTLLLVGITFSLVMVHWNTSIDREREIFDAITLDDHRLLGHALHNLATAMLQRRTPEELKALVSSLPNGRETRMRWEWLLPGASLGLGGPLTAEDWRHLGEGRPVSRLDGRPGVARAICVVPVNAQPDRIGALVVDMLLFKREVFMRREVVELLCLLASIVVVSPLLIFAIGHLLLGRPLSSLMRLVKQVSDGDLTGSVHLEQRDELGLLGDHLSCMVARLRASREALVHEEEATRSAHLQLWHLDRLALLGQMAAGVAHEVGTPLNVIQGHARMIGGGSLDAEGVKSSAKTICEQTARITQILKDMLGLARRRSSPREPTDLHALAASTIRLVSAAHRVTPKLIVEGDERVKPIVTVDPAQIQQVLMNLLVNAIQAGDPEVVVGIVPDGEKGCPDGDEPLVGLYVQDSGPGVPPEIREKIFEPFFTTKEVAQGSGLGLSIAREIVLEHGGCLHLDDRVSKGARFWMYLPRTEASV